MEGLLPVQASYVVLPLSDFVVDARLRRKTAVATASPQRVPWRALFGSSSPQHCLFCGGAYDAVN
jgi:hypothetical protein